MVVLAIATTIIADTTSRCDSLWLIEVGAKLAFFGAISWFLYFNDEREMKGRDVPPNVPICLDEISKELKLYLI